MENPEKPAKSGQTANRRYRFVVQATGAQYFVIVFGHAFATEIAPALRTAGNCLPQHMVEASLMQQVFHH
jgi:hypothetical protein